MGKRALVVALVLAAVSGLAASAGGGRAGDVVLASLPSSTGDLRAIRVVGTDGSERGRLKLPETPSRAITAAVPGRVVYTTSDGGVFVVDAPTRRVTRVAVPATRDLSVADSRFTGGGRYQVLANAPSDSAYLLDTATAKATSLTALDKSLDFVFGGVFSPDERYLLLFGRSTWLVPTARPSAARQLRESGRIGGFAPDSRRVAYVAGPSTVVVEGVGASGRTTMRPRLAGPLLVRFVPPGNRLLVVGENAAGLVPAAGGVVRRLGALPSAGINAWLDPSGKGALVWLDDKGYAWIDLVRGAVRPLPQLKEYVLLPGQSGRRLFLIDRIDFGAGGRRFAALDLATGSLRTAFRLPRDVIFLGATIADGGAYAAVVGEKARRSTVWVVRASGGASAVASARGITPRFSPEGDQLAVGELNGAGKTLRSRLEWVDPATGRRKPLGAGFAPAWALGG